MVGRCSGGLRFPALSVDQPALYWEKSDTSCEGDINEQGHSTGTEKIRGARRAPTTQNSKLKTQNSKLRIAPSGAPGGSPARIALEAGAVAHQGEGAALGARVALVAHVTGLLGCRSSAVSGWGDPTGGDRLCG